MKGGFKIIWSQNAKEEFEDAVKYLESFFSEKEVTNLLKETNRISKLISDQPTLYPSSETNEMRKAVVLKYNTLYYKIIENNVFIVSFFSNRQSPEKII